MKKLIAAMALSAGLAMPASASISIVAASAPGDPTANYFDDKGWLTGTSFYSGDSLSISKAGTFYFWYMGTEAGYLNTFNATGDVGSTTFNTHDDGDSDALDNYFPGGWYAGSVGFSSGGALDPTVFNFHTAGGMSAPAGTFNMNDDEFAFYSTAASGVDWLYLAFDDGGGNDGDDDNHDDMIILAKFVAAVPEPATWLMMIMGFGLVGLAARRRSAIATA